MTRLLGWDGCVHVGDGQDSGDRLEVLRNSRHAEMGTKFLGRARIHDIAASFLLDRSLRLCLSQQIA